MSTPIEDLLDGLGPVFRWAEARSAGLTQPRLYRLVEAGRVERIGHGLYLRTDAPPMDLDLIEVASAAPQATLCLTSALAYHGLIDGIPSRIHLALPANAHRPVLTAAVSWHQFAAETFDTGRSDLEVAVGYTIGLYDSGRSICRRLPLAPSHRGGHRQGGASHLAARCGQPVLRAAHDGREVPGGGAADPQRPRGAAVSNTAVARYRALQRRARVARDAPPTSS